MYRREIRYKRQKYSEYSTNFEKFYQKQLEDNPMLKDKVIFNQITCIVFTHFVFLAQQDKVSLLLNKNNVLGKICPPNVHIEFDIHTLYKDLGILIFN